jgi:hypothetical protein
MISDTFWALTILLLAISLALALLDNWRPH